MTAVLVEWLTPRDIHVKAKRSLSRIRQALADGLLHGHQTGPGGSWSVHPEAVNAWIAGLSPEVQESRCACRPPEPAAAPSRKGARR